MFLPVQELVANEKMRLFVAIELPESVKDELEKAQMQMRGALPKDAFRWTKKPQFHLTLRFLGSVPITIIEPLMEALRVSCRPLSGMTLAAKELGAFPEVGYPRVLWAGVASEGEKLLRLQEVIEQACAKFTTEKSEKPYQPHLTLGRAATRRVRAGREFGEFLLKNGSRTFGQWQATDVNLFRSSLSSEGAQHTVLGKFPLEHLP